MVLWLCRWPNEEDEQDTIDTARKYLQDGKYLASNGECPKKGDLVVFRNSVNMRKNANEDRFSTFATGVVSISQNQVPPNWMYRQRTCYISFENIENHNFIFEKGAFSTWGHNNWPNTHPNIQFMRLNEWQIEQLDL